MSLWVRHCYRAANSNKSSCNSNEREETIVARIALPNQGSRRAFAEVVSVPGQQSRQISAGSNHAAISAPNPPPPPPVSRPSPVSTHRGGISLLSGRVMTRLSDASSVLRSCDLILTHYLPDGHYSFHPSRHGEYVE